MLVYSLKRLVTRGQFLNFSWQINDFIIQCSHHLSSHWLKAYSKFWETAQPTDYSLIYRYRLVNNLKVALFPRINCRLLANEKTDGDCNT